MTDEATFGGRSLRRVLMIGIVAPVLAFLLINSISLHRQALSAADTATLDRTLLASAKAIGELLDVRIVAGRTVLVASLPYSALEAFEADNRSRMVYKVTGFDGETVTGFDDLRSWRGALPERNHYAALVHFYDDEHRGAPVRVAVLLQPVAGQDGLGMATIQVAETLELRHALARELLVRTAWQQGLLLLVVTVVVALVVQRATRPIRMLSAQVRSRAENDLSPLPVTAAPKELQPMVEATNLLMGRLAQLLEHQKRFVRDTSHQLRTPLAVLKTQVQSALRGDISADVALKEIEHTVASASELANQMLALAKVEQLRQQGDPPSTQWAAVVRGVALDVSPLIAEKHLDFELQAEGCSVRAHEWALRELTRNLLHNAIRHSPAGAPLQVSVGPRGRSAVLRIRDCGPGIDPQMRQRLFQPFARADRPVGEGAGLGLSICSEIVRSLGGSLGLDNRHEDGRIVGLDVQVSLPGADADGA